MNTDNWIKFDGTNGPKGEWVSVYCLIVNKEYNTCLIEPLKYLSFDMAQKLVDDEGGYKMVHIDETKWKYPEATGGFFFVGEDELYLSNHVVAYFNLPVQEFAKNVAQSLGIEV